MDNAPRLVKRKPVIQNEITQVYKEIYSRPDSTTFSMITRDGPPVVCILPFLTPDTILLIRQYRIVWGEWSWEIPCGHVDGSESLEAAAHRELEEETGFRAAKLVSRYNYLLTAISPQSYHIYHATELTETKQNLDETEQIEVHPTTLQEVQRLIKNRVFKHAPTLLALYDFFFTADTSY
ncbi:MAG: NUDIX hydrolase [Candidatus Ranarchaeia archaeon]